MEDTHVWVMDADGSEPPRDRRGDRQPAGRAGVGRPTARALLSRCRSAATCGCTASPLAGGAAGARRRPSAARSAASRPRRASSPTRSSSPSRPGAAVRRRRRRAPGTARLASSPTSMRDVLARQAARRSRVVHLRLERQQVRGRSVPHEAGRSAPRSGKIPADRDDPRRAARPAGTGVQFQEPGLRRRGWATLMVNYRGSTGYGQTFADAVFARSERRRSAGRALRRRAPRCGATRGSIAIGSASRAAATAASSRPG